MLSPLSSGGPFRKMKPSSAIFAATSIRQKLPYKVERSAAAGCAPDAKLLCDLANLDELELRSSRGIKMSTMCQATAIRVGVVAGEPLRLEGLTSVFEREPEFGQSQLLPVIGPLDELLADPDLEYLIVDLNAGSRGVEMLKEIRRQRPSLRLIVIGPAGNDALVMDSIIAGARAYLDMTAGPRVVREAIEVVVSGSIWAPRRLLSRLIDRLLRASEGDPHPMGARLTAREHQVMDLILLARSNREIARELGIEERTVKAHVGRLMRKTGAENRIDLSMKALNGLLPHKGHPSGGPSNGSSMVAKPSLSATAKENSSY